MFATDERLNAVMTEEANLLPHKPAALQALSYTTGNLLATLSRALLHGAPLVPPRQLSSWPAGTQRLSPQLQDISQRLGWERTL